LRPPRDCQASPPPSASPTATGWSRPITAAIYGPGETLTYAAQRLLTRQSLAREFSRSQISNPPFANETAPPSDDFKRLQAGGFKDWRLAIDGLVAQPASLSLDDVKRFRCAGRSPKSRARKAGRTSRSGSGRR